MEQDRPRSPVLHCPKLPSVPSTPLKSELNADAMDLDSNGRAVSVLSIEDAEKLAAAAALSDLQAEVQSPPKQRASSFHGADGRINASSATAQNPEPLLDLLTSSHPYLSTAISGPLSAYSSSKSYSPRFKSGAEFVERHIGSPVASTVGSVGRRTGVEGGVRWWLKRTDSKGGESEGSRNKRRRVSSIEPDDMDIEKGLRSPRVPAYTERRESEVSLAESLPAYDDERSPTYEERGTTASYQHEQGASQTTPNRNWQQRLILSTSGLGVAMSEESLKSLRYCLGWLDSASDRLRTVLRALEDVLDEWDHGRDQSRQQPRQPPSDSKGTEEHQSSQPSKPSAGQRAESTISQRIQALNSEATQLLRSAVDIVTKYAGGALPENARVLVRRHLTSLPGRFRSASISSTSNGSMQPASETAKNRYRAVVFAREGLAMVVNVSEVIHATIVSAQEWCERFGRRQRGEPDSPVEPQPDCKERPASEGTPTSSFGQDKKDLSP